MQTKEQAMAHCREVGERIERCVAEGGDLFAQFEGVQMLNFKLEKTDAGLKVVGGELGGDDPRITVSESGASKPWNDEIVDRIKMEIDFNLNKSEYKNIQKTLRYRITLTGMELKECVDTCRRGLNPAPAPGLSQGLADLPTPDGTADAARDTLLADLRQPVVPVHIHSREEAVEDGKALFTFRFPDGQTLVAKTGDRTDDDVRNHNKTITAKIETLCGKVHPAQTASVYRALSQDGLAPCLDAFRTYGIRSGDRMPVTFTLAKDDATGAVTITYTPPEGFPVPFTWTATVATTPLLFPPKPPEKGPDPVPDINLTVVNGITMPRLAGKEDLMNFVLSLDIDKMHGKVTEDGMAKDVKGDDRKIYTYQGIIFRGDGRRPTDPTMKTGFTSKKDLTVRANKLEAMGLGVETDAPGGGKTYGS